MRPLWIDRHATPASRLRQIRSRGSPRFRSGRSSEALRDAGATNSTQAVALSPSPGFSLALV